MADLKGGFIGVLLAVFGLVLTVFGWFWIPAIAGFMEITLLKGMFYIGFFLTWVLSFIVTPTIYIMGGNGDIRGVVKGILTFFVGTFCSIIAYWVVLPLNEVMYAIFTNDAINSIAWFIVILFWGITMIVLPAYFITKSYMPKKESAE